MNRRFELCDPGKDHCDFCSNHQWTGLWRADAKVILICRECALKVLPALFADATWYPAWRPNTGAQHLATFEANYWRAQTSIAYLGKHCAPFATITNSRHNNSKEKHGDRS